AMINSYSTMRRADADHLKNEAGGCRPSQAWRTSTSGPRVCGERRPRQVTIAETASRIAALEPPSNPMWGLGRGCRAQATDSEQAIHLRYRVSYRSTPESRR
ncbi:hypothetical protein, partial [Micropruina sp.]|uniref:hypothetical protein n=1 Tax=Micropruina sp. TaxID=2737536 RepID=UPI00261AE67B